MECHAQTFHFIFPKQRPLTVRPASWVKASPILTFAPHSIPRLELRLAAWRSLRLRYRCHRKRSRRKRRAASARRGGRTRDKRRESTEIKQKCRVRRGAVLEKQEHVAHACILARAPARDIQRVAAAAIKHSNFMRFVAL